MPRHFSKLCSSTSNKPKKFVHFDQEQLRQPGILFLPLPNVLLNPIYNLAANAVEWRLTSFLSPVHYFIAVHGHRRTISKHLAPPLRVGRDAILLSCVEIMGIRSQDLSIGDTGYGGGLFWVNEGPRFVLLSKDALRLSLTMLSLSC